MRRLLIGLTIATMVALGAPHANADPPPDNVSQLCKAAGDGGLSHGGCVSLLTNGNLTAAIADFCRDPANRQVVSTMFGTGAVINHGECVKLLKANLP